MQRRVPTMTRDARQHARSKLMTPGILVAAMAISLMGCAVETSTAPSPSPRTGSTAPQQPQAVTLDRSQVERIKRVMPPLIQAMNKPIDLKKVKIGVMD